MRISDWSSDVCSSDLVVQWGLCEADSAILFYAQRDSRVAGVALLNPWVRTTESEADPYLRHYYLRRLRDRGFWQSAVRGKVNPVPAARPLGQLLTQRFALAGAQPPDAPRHRPLDRERAWLGKRGSDRVI